MPDNNDKLLSKNLPSDGSKVEVVVKHDGSDGAEAEIDLMNIFKNMGRKKRIYIWVIAFAMVLGILIPLFSQLTGNKVDSVSSVITLDYPLAGELKAPDGSDLDMGFIMSSHILSSALRNAHLEDKLSTSAVSANMQVQRMLSDNTKQQLEILEKFDGATLNASAPGGYVDVVNSIQYTYKNRYIIVLKNGFGTEKNTVFLTGEELSSLLNSIMAVFKDYFFETYESFELPDNRIEDISLDELDYIEWLDNMTEILDSLSDYCTDEDKAEYLNYRSSIDGLTFNDINDLIQLVKKVRVDYLYSYVYYNCLSRDKNSTLTKFNYKLRTLNQQLDIINNNIADGASLIENYHNENILFSSKADDETGLSASTTSVTDYYNELILKQSDYYSRKAALELQLKNTNDKIEGFSKSIGSTAQHNVANKEINEVNQILQKLYTLIRNHAEEITSSDFYANSFMTCIDAAYEAEGLLSFNTLKKMGMGVGIGFFIAFFIWCMDGLIAEFKDSDARAKAARVSD